MSVLQFLALRLAKSLDWLGSLFYQLSRMVYGFLPALLRPAQLQRLMNEHYGGVYTDGFFSDSLEFQQDGLHCWEKEILDRYHINSGRMLVLGAGWGREAIAIAQRGVRVVGIEMNAAVARTARHRAKTVGVPALFLQADMLKLPTDREWFDCVLLSQHMYSAIAGKSQRQTWLTNLRRVLRPDGRVILSFLSERPPASRLRTARRRLTMMVARLPGANHGYQIGDDCGGGHFLHWFQEEAEIRSELLGAGVRIQDLNLSPGFAILTYPASPARRLLASPTTVST
jgi:2-polyprenyl-3-methyl-5-hydroxy-6-metoxy-1,4-benzoquinol methylase